VIALVTPVYQGLFLLFVIVCTTVGITGLIWCAVELGIKSWGRVADARELYAAVLHIRRASRDNLARSFGTPRRRDD
jgi:hypothetical protein